MSGRPTAPITSADQPCIPGVIKRREVKDERALREQLEAWAEMQSLTRIIVSHGHVIANDAQGVLRRIASHLAA